MIENKFSPVVKIITCEFHRTSLVGLDFVQRVTVKIFGEFRVNSTDEKFGIGKSVSY